MSDVTSLCTPGHSPITRGRSTIQAKARLAGKRLGSWEAQGHMAAANLEEKKTLEKAPLNVVHTLPLWQLDIEELTGHNLEARGREEVNHLLQSGWLLLHIYTLKYHEDGVWRERPMAILGRPRTNAHDDIL